MSKYSFAYQGGLIIITTTISGSNKVSKELRLALDTGSDRTIITPPYIRAIGYSKNDKIRNLSMTTGSKNELAYELKINQLEALGYMIKDSKIIVKSFPTGLYFLDGLLGLDFFQQIGKKLIIDFANNEIELQ